MDLRRYSKLDLWPKEGQNWNAYTQPKNIPQAQAENFVKIFKSNYYITLGCRNF